MAHFEVTTDPATAWCRCGVWCSGRNAGRPRLHRIRRRQCKLGQLLARLRTAVRVSWRAGTPASEVIMRLPFMGPNIKSLVEKHDVPALVRAWGEAASGERDQIRHALRDWLGDFDKGRAHDAARALIGLGHLDVVLERWHEWTRPSSGTSEEVVSDGRATNLILLLCEVAVRSQDVALAIHLLKDVERWDLQALDSGVRVPPDRRPPLENLVPLLRDQCSPAELVDLILHAPSRHGSAIAECALQERGGSEAVTCYQRGAADGRGGALGGSLREKQQRTFVGEDNRTRGSNPAERRILELADTEVRKDARKLAQRLEASALPQAESRPLVRVLRQVSGKR